MTRTVLALLAACATVVTVSAGPERPVPISERAKGAQTIVVAKVIEVSATFERNEFGDQVIVSHTFLQVEQALKGAPPQVMPFDVEGGTVGGLTLKVSDLQSVAVGERAVFFVTRSKSGANVPHLRGNGIVKLDATNHVHGSTSTLEDVKRLVQQSLK